MNIVSQKGGINNDAISIFRINIGAPITFKWVAKHFGYIHNKQFQDKMIKGPFKNGSILILLYLKDQINAL